jgi:hypothetical protein
MGGRRAGGRRGRARVEVEVEGYEYGRGRGRRFEGSDDIESWYGTPSYAARRLARSRRSRRSTARGVSMSGTSTSGRSGRPCAALTLFHRMRAAFCAHGVTNPG